MKKFLSLVLALVMTMSLVTVSAGAKDFGDSDDLSGEQYEEAVNVMSEMGIIDGYSDGDFRPQGTLTRQAAAKIIACMMLGKTTAESLGTSAAPFKDVPAGSSFAGYIAFCVERGLISGYADGTFRPTGTLTGFAFLKMLLGALGYDQSIEGYTGTNWTVNVAGRAYEIGLTDGNADFLGSKACTREEAALYAVNTLQATLVEYKDKGSSVTINGAVITTGASDPTYVTSSIYNQATSINKDKDNASGDYTVEFAERYQPDLAKDPDTDPFGRPSYTWSWKSKDIGTYVDYSLMVAEYTTEVEGGDVYSAIGSTAADYDLTYVQDGVEMSKNDTKTQASYIAKKNDDTMGDTGNGVLTQVFVDTDAEELTITEINTYLAETDDYNEKKETLKFNDIYGYNNNVKDVELDDFPSIEGYVDGDMVLLTIADGEVQSIIDAESVTGVEIDEFSKKDYVQADGTKYSYALTGTLSDSLGNDILDDYDNNNLDDKTFNIYLDTYGYLIGIEQVEDDTEYVFITSYEVNSKFLTNRTAEATAIFSDGTIATIDVDLRNSDEDTVEDVWTEGKTNENRWYSYTVKNESYRLTLADNQIHDVTTDKIDSKNLDQKGVDAAGVADNNYYYGNADTNYIVVSVDRINDYVAIDDVDSVTTGVKNVSINVYNTESKAEDAAEYEAESGKVAYGIYSVYDGAYVVASVVVGDDGSVSDRYAYMYGEPSRERYNKTEDIYYWDMDAVIDGVKTTVTFKSDLPFTDTVLATDEIEEVGAMLKLSYDHDGYAVDAQAIKHNTDYNWLYEYTSMDPDDVKILTNGTGNAVALEAKGDTLWITNQEQLRGYALADECPAVIVEYNEDGDGIDEVSEYSTVEKAIKNLDNYDDGVVDFFDGTIYMIFKDGIVSSVVLTDTVEDVEHLNPGNDRNEGIRLNSLGIVGATSSTSGSVTVNVTNLDDSDVITAIDSKVAVRVVSASGTQLLYAESTLSDATNGTGGFGASQTKDLSFAYAGSQAASGDYTVTVTITNGTGDDATTWTATQVLHLA